jgi:ribosome biogenesis protein Nip4
MIKPILDFVSLFGININLNEDQVVTKGNRYFLVSEDLKKAMSRDFFCAGSYLGKIKNAIFFPGFELLRMMTEKNANRIVVDKKTEWLFICGRDIFKQGITTVTGSSRRGDYVLVLNRHNECLGFGRIICDLNKTTKGVVVKNVLDVGDFLRRETHAS